MASGKEIEQPSLSINEANFSLLREDGPFATPRDRTVYGPHSQIARQWLRSLSPNQKTEFVSTRNQICQLLDVESFREIPALIPDRERRDAVRRRAYRLIGNMYGVTGTEAEVVSQIRGYAKIADGIIYYLQKGVLSSYAPYLEMTNEVLATDDPVDLLCLTFDERYHQKARFEAKRKLFLMSLAGAIDQRERETNVEAKFRDFLEFLNDHVWHYDKIAEVNTVHLLSIHDPKTFACVSVTEVVDGHEQVLARNAILTPHEKLTMLQRRQFRANGRNIPIYVTVREKTPEARVLKLLRKGFENPAVAVDDELGLMGVLPETPDVDLFLKHLTQSAVRAGSLMNLEEIETTLGGETHRTTAIGSSPNTRMLKFFARVNGMRIEFILHTNQTFLDYTYRDGVSHEEYQAKRLLDSGSAELLFPKNLFILDTEKIRGVLIRDVRARIRGQQSTAS